MSWEATAWAKKTRGHTSAGQKLVLLILADYHNTEKGMAWPSQRTLADDCEIPIRTIQHHLRTLEQTGFITTLQKGNQHSPSQYRLNFACTQSREPATSEPATIAHTPEPAISDIVNPQPHTSEPATPRITSRQEPPIEPTLSNRKKVSKSSSSPSGSPEGGTKTVEPLEVSDEFRAKMAEKYLRYWGAERTVAIIEDALNHKASRKWIKVERGVDGWLRREMERVGGRSGINQGHTSADNPENTPAKRAERLANRPRAPD